MKYRMLGKTGFRVSEVSLGTWQIGGKWGENFNDDLAEKNLNIAIEKGVNFIDTADVYNDGMSEKVSANIIKSHKDKIYLATKCGRRLNPHNADGYNRKNIRKFVHDSLLNMKCETLDLIQLHCPPTEVYSRPEIFDVLEELKKEGKILYYGVSVEKVDEALKAIEYEGVSTVQIIFNIFRQKPAEKFFKEAKQKNVGVIVRVPLASGLLTGKFNKNTVFGKGDHRFFNRNGEHFDKGETFSGVDYEKGLEAVKELVKLFNGSFHLAQYALRWILMFKEVSCVIPGASKPFQVHSNISASDLPVLTEEQMDNVKNIYDKYFKKDIHKLW